MNKFVRTVISNFSVVIYHNRMPSVKFILASIARSIYKYEM